MEIALIQWFFAAFNFFVNSDLQFNIQIFHKFLQETIWKLHILIQSLFSKQSENISTNVNTSNNYSSFQSS